MLFLKRIMLFKVLVFIFIYSKVAFGEEPDNLAGIIYTFNVEEFGDPYEVNLTNVAKTDSKIVNGELAEKFEFPYQAALYITRMTGEQSFCGGCLISEKHVLTAAHCTYKRSKRLIVVVGTNNLWSGSQYEKRIDVKRLTIHRYYNHETLRNDISVLELKQAVQFNKAVQPVYLPRYRDAQKNYIHKMGVVSGYGLIHDSGSPVNQLMFSVVKVMDNLMCNKAFDDVEATYSNICTAGYDRRGPCQGDSGGPLVIEKKLMGIVSYGAVRCTSGYPVIYTRVPRYLEWISYNTGIIPKD